MKKRRTILNEKLKESLSSVLPVAGIVFFLCFTIVPVPNSILMAFVIGTVFLIAGMGIFTLGADLAMSPIGQHVGSAITRSKKLWLVITIAFSMGALITVSEPDLQVLAEQVQNVPNLVLIGAIAVGVGGFLVISMLRILFRIPLTYLLIFFYIIIFVLAQFAPKDFLSIAFDSGGVTTGPMTVPFIMALGVGVAATRSDKDADLDSFGLVSLCSVGPILAVMILSFVYHPESSDYTAISIPHIEDSRELWMMFLKAFPKFSKEVGLALLPIVAFFGVFQLIRLRLHRTHLIRIGVGILYTYLGLVLFLTGVNVGFLPTGNYLGQQLGALPYNWVIVPIGMIIGYFMVAAEPAVHVLNKQVFEITSGVIPKKAMNTSLSIGVSISAGLAMLRILTGLPIMYLLIPGYAIAIILSFFVPPIFTAIAFDSGGVASGPMAATFLLPLAMGACASAGGNIVTDAFGVVAMVAMTPLITIQCMGLFFKWKTRHAEEISEDDTTEEIIEL